MSPGLVSHRSRPGMQRADVGTSQKNAYASASATGMTTDSVTSVGNFAMGFSSGACSRPHRDRARRVQGAVPIALTVPDPACTTPRMRFYEYEAKALFAKHNTPLLKGRVAKTAVEAK